MAERSTAAVDVADSSDAQDEPSLTAKADKATADGTEAGNTEESSVGVPPDTERATGGKGPRGDRVPELHSGHKLAGRYRLEECVTRLEGFSSWRAVDEKLRRAVGVHLLPAEHPRARTVLAAARSAALLGDPRFVQVLDAVEEDALVYVVHEWLPDATELTSVLASGPMAAFDAYQLVSQVSQAMAAAHREGLSHLRLGPGCVLRTGSGQYRIRGLAVMAALRGITSDTPQRTDTEAIGALLYAALTQRWPYEGDAHGLAGLPKDVGLIPPDQVRAGVHRGLSQLAMRALVNDGATASRQEPPCTTPEELAKAVSAMPRIRPPETPFSATPSYPRPPAGGAYGPQTVHSAPLTPPPPLQSRTGTAIKWIVSSLLIAALGLGSWQLADTLLKHTDSEDDPQQSQLSDNEARRKKPQQKQLPIEKVMEFSPLASPTGPKSVSLAADGDENTAWKTGAFYGYPRFGNLDQRAQGSGIVVDLGKVKEVSRIDVRMFAGQTIEIRAADTSASQPSALADFPKELLGSRRVPGENLQVVKSVKTRYVLVHLTELPLESGNTYRGGIYEIKVFGTRS
ncbi:MULTISPECIES: protein kinase family protein [Streptomyces]|uniref:protein kinase family protein n=1 Tax=Streptomyces TaxID=1883 RepID=UPI00163B89C9|nr:MULTISPECIES: protein kinase family protein [Streptomyces]MBC2873706.1 serine/threonine protein kinase [Streptomyces sp. TYQ1024]UBI37866.1 serine/threonine protein kinase [Streptomyces mobaraensis]UKW30454.1 serine/threonine protein kinase [Streptomyces sp. TYQ1024]